MHPNGQLPRTNGHSVIDPQFMPWLRGGCTRLTKRKNGKGDREFLERILSQAVAHFTLVGQSQGRPRNEHLSSADSWARQHWSPFDRSGSPPAHRRLH